MVQDTLVIGSYHNPVETGTPGGLFIDPPDH